MTNRKEGAGRVWGATGQNAERKPAMNSLHEPDDTFDNRADALSAALAQLDADIEHARQAQERADRYAAVLDVAVIALVSLLAGCLVAAAITWPIGGALLAALAAGISVGAFITWAAG